MTNQVHADAETVWNYLRRDEPKLKPADAILLFGSHDIRVADFAAQLYADKYAPTIIVSGGLAPGSRTIYGEPEAAVFSRRLKQAGVPAAAILQEDKAMSTAENIKFSYKLISRKLPELKSLILVQKPYMTRRAYAAFMKQWPGESIDVQTASTDQTFDEYADSSIPTDKIINTMVGDLQRIREYPKRGFQIEQPVPEAVWQAWQRLVDAGYTKHLI